MSGPSRDGAGPGTVWLAITPGIFVFLWSTGFIGAKLGLPSAEPMTFLALRFFLVSSLLIAFVLIVRAPWPGSWAATGHIAVVGLLLHGVYLGGVFASIDLGVEAGVSALIVGVQPLLTAVAAGPVLGERVTPRQWLGLLLGFLGVTLVVCKSWRSASVPRSAWRSRSWRSSASPPARSTRSASAAICR